MFFWDTVYDCSNKYGYVMRRYNAGLSDLLSAKFDAFM